MLPYSEGLSATDSRRCSFIAVDWRQRIPHPFLVANRLTSGSYVSGAAALAHAHAIPEYVAEVASVTTGRPMRAPCPDVAIKLR